MQIKIDDLTHPQVKALLSTHLSVADVNTAKDTSHALSLEALRAPNITIWSVWSEECLMGIGALKELTSRCGELKSVHTAKEHRRKGVSRTLMRHIMEVARERNYDRLCLETHPTEGYAAARALYHRLGFSVCPAFGDYKDTPDSIFMSIDL